MKFSEEDIDCLINNKPFIYYNYETGLMTQQEEETMDYNLNTPEFKPVPTKLTDAEVEKLLAAKPLDGEVTYDDAVVYVTDLDEMADEPTPTVH